MTTVHPTAVVESGVELADDVVIGPYCVVSGEVEIGSGVRLESHVVVGGRTTIGPNCRLYPFSAIGLPPQDLKYKGEPSRLIVGSDNTIREYVTMNPGTEGGGMTTRVGNHCLFMIGVHIAHDCTIGDNVIMANNATLGGHVSVGDYAVLGGLAAVHQFVRIGRHAMVGGMSGVEHDVIPYGSVMGDRASLMGLNVIGMKRRGIGRDEIHALRTAYRLLFAPEGTMAERLDDVAQLFPDNQAVMDIVEFIAADSPRSVCQPKDGRPEA